MIIQQEMIRIIDVSGCMYINLLISECAEGKFNKLSLFVLATNPYPVCQIFFAVWRTPCAPCVLTEWCSCDFGDCRYLACGSPPSCVIFTQYLPNDFLKKAGSFNNSFVGFFDSLVLFSFM
jgi:hypothetical protein